MSTTSATVAGVCRMIAERTGDQQAAHILRQAGEKLDRLTAELAKHKPEERVGRCWCGHCEHVSGRWCELYPTMPDGEPEAGPVPWSHCPYCGAELGADGIARRNADTGLLNALELMVLGSAEHGEQVELDARHEGHGVLLVTWHTWTENFGSGEHTGADLRAAIRAALVKTDCASEVDALRELREKLATAEAQVMRVREKLDELVRDAAEPREQCEAGQCSDGRQIIVCQRIRAALDQQGVGDGVEPAH